VFGTPGYMSPEQAEGEAAEAASDVFALGCVITYAATGAGPFGSGTAAAVLYRVVHGEPALDRVPPELREIISACLAKDPADRPGLRTLATEIASGRHATGPSAVAFWPPPVAGIIGAYQARLEQETSASRQPAQSQGFSWATSVHPPTKPADPGSSSQGSQWPQQPPPPPSPPPSPGPGPGWPYAGSGSHTGLGSPGGGGPAGSRPQPQGYGGAQAGRASQASQVSPAPPRGYLPAGGGAAASGGPVGYPPPYRLGSRGAIYQLPGTMVAAVRLMYAGAAYALIYAIGFLLVVNSILKNEPANHTSVGGVAAAVILLSLIEIAVWLWIARACRNGRSWARVTGTVLFGIHTLSALAVLGSTHPGLGRARLLTIISWLIACGAVVFLWQRPSSAFFRARAAINR